MKGRVSVATRFKRACPSFVRNPKYANARHMRSDVSVVEISVALNRARSLVQLGVRKVDRFDELLDGLRVGCKALINWLKVTLCQWTDIGQCAILVRVVCQLDANPVFLSRGFQPPCLRKLGLFFLGFFPQIFNKCATNFAKRPVEEWQSG